MSWIKIRRSGRRLRLLLGTAVLACLMTALLTRSGAWLYDASDIDVDYTVAQLRFDLSSDHMYTYYRDNPAYLSPDGAAGFYKTVEALTVLQGQADDGTLSMGDYEDAVIPLLRQAYPAAFIDSLVSLQQRAETGTLSQEQYNEETKALYNAYTDKIEFPFKIKSIDFNYVESGRSLLYYQVADILALYGGRYVVQRNADGVSSATLNIGVKLKGGTTYQQRAQDTVGNVTAEPAPYYDENFNDMVMPLSLRLDNTGNASLFLSLGMTLDADADKGILCMVMARSFDMNAEDPHFAAGDYRAMIAYLLEEGTATGNAAFDDFRTAYGGYTTEKWQNLTASQMAEALRVWNACALKTYRGETAPYNIKVSQKLEGGASHQDIQMLFWADYEANAAYYASIEGGDWAGDDDYLLIKYNFRLNIKTSLKDQDLNSGSVDFSQSYNKEKDYDKFAGVSNFDVEGYAYFLQDDGSELNAQTYIAGGYIHCNYIDETEKNHISRFRFSVRYRGFSPAYLRVRLIEQWTNSQEEVEGINQLRFAKASGWVDNRAKDLFFYSDKLYYSTDKDVLMTSGKAKVVTIPVITGLQEDVQETDPTLNTKRGLTLRLSLLVEAVQPNRFEEIWHINSIPTVDAEVLPGG